MEETSFEFFYINGSIEGKTLKAGDYIKLPDPVYGHKFLSRVAQASPAGYVTLIDDGGILTLSKESAQKLEIVDEKKVPDTHRAFFDEVLKKFVTDGEEDRTDLLEKGAKMYFADKEKTKLAEEKAEKDAKKLEKSTATKAELDLIKIKTDADVKAFVKKLNTNAPNLTPEHKKALTEKVEKVKAKLAQKTTETPKAGAPKQETPAPKARQPRASKSKENTAIATPENITVTEEVKA